MMNTSSPTLLLILVVFFGALRVGNTLSSLAPWRSHVASTTARTAIKGNVNSDFPPEEETAEEYSGTVDWDAEWKKVVQSGGTQPTSSGAPKERPGKDFYKSEAEIAAIRAANKATESASKLAAQVPSIPSFDSVKGDWKFWVGLLALVSFGTALLTAQAPMPTNGGAPSSYYI